MSKTLIYQALFQPVPPQDSGAATPSVLWFQPLSEPILQPPEQAVVEIARSIDFSGGVAQAVVWGWDQQSQVPARKKLAPESVEFIPPSPYTTASNSPVGTEWFSPLSLPTLLRHQSHTDQAWCPQPISAPSNAPAGMDWFTPLSEPVPQLQPAPLVGYWTPAPGSVTSRVGACYATFDWSMTQPIANGWSMTSGSATDYSICPE